METREAIELRRRGKEGDGYEIGEAGTREKDKYHLFLGFGGGETEEEIGMVCRVQGGEGTDEDLPGRVLFQKVVELLEWTRTRRWDLSQGNIAI
jgi:hypothetical protein